jgi:hypothetical protein
MRGIAFALAAAAFVATTPHPVAAQCYGPECDRQRSGPPPQFNERPSFNERPNFHPNPGNNGQPYRSAPHVQGQPHQGQPYQGPPPYQGQPYQGQPYQGQPHQGQPYQGQPPGPRSQPPYQRPAYQGQPRPPGYADMPPGAQPRGPGYRGPRPDERSAGRTHVVPTHVTKLPKTKRSAVRHHQPGPTGRTVVRNAPPAAGAGQITISVAEYRDLQNQARELQRLMSSRGGAPTRARAPNGPSPFPDVGPQGMPPRQ